MARKRAAPPNDASDVAEALSADAVRYVANISKGRGLTGSQAQYDREVRGLVERRFPGLDKRAIDTVLRRAEESIRQAAQFERMQPNQKLSARQLPSRDTGCTNWRYNMIAYWSDEETGTSGRHAVQWDTQGSKTLEQARGHATRVTELYRDTRDRKYGYGNLPSGAVVTEVRVITVERSCP